MAVKIITFGCRLNIYESEVIKKFLQEDEDINNKNVIIFNSCAVTAEAEKQLRQAIRKERRENQDYIIGLTGCAPQTSPDVYKNMKEVDFILGNIDKMKKENYDIIKTLSKKEKSQNTAIVSNIFQDYELTTQIIGDFENKKRGFIQVQCGCDNFCTFCATRLARGKSFSIPSNKIINQVNKLVENGYKEIVLTGIDISDYGKRLDENINLGKLVKKITQETDIQRIRLSSLDINDINADLKDILFNESRMMPHIHLSLQSGDDTILKKMARRHTRQETIDFCNEIRRYRKNLGLGADLIAGFPTEDENMHKNTCDLIGEINLVFGHIFPYSVRENTPAATMKQIPVEIRRKRAKELRLLVEKELENFTNSQKSYKHNVLIEDNTNGRTENYLSVKLDKETLKNNKIGDIINIDI